MKQVEVVVTNGEISLEEQKKYVRYIAKKYPHIFIEKLFLSADGDFVDIRIQLRKRILTKMGGAVIGDPLTWNNAKQAEFRDTIPNKVDL